MTKEVVHLILCNGAKQAYEMARKPFRPLRLEWRERGNTPRNINLGLPRFIDTLLHLPARTLDLLELATYVYAADRLITRGRPDAVEYHSWGRRFHFRIKLRDEEFWRQARVTNALQEALKFCTGDPQFDFTFLPGHRTPPTSLFDAAEVSHTPVKGTRVALFSGGLDSLAGAVECLSTTKRTICLVSHRSQPGTVKTQKALARELEQQFPSRVQLFPFELTLHGKRASEETQRSRPFLYGAIAFAVASALRQNSFAVYENGVTSLSIPEREDLLNARASRTTHPKTLSLLAKLLSLVAGKKFSIEAPYRWKTRADVFRILRRHKATELISSAVSCSRTFQIPDLGTHCGGCSQCVERRLAAHATGMEDLDCEAGIYARDFMEQPIWDGEVRAQLIDYIRVARDLANANRDRFYHDYLTLLIPIREAFPESPEAEIVEKVWSLCQRHGHEVLEALRRVQIKYADPSRELTAGTLPHLIAHREYLRTPVERAVSGIRALLERSLPIAFRSQEPKDEQVLNDEIHAQLSGREEEFRREFPSVQFGIAQAVPDHSSAKLELFIEGKYIRKATSPSKATEGMAADLTKYPEGVHVLFVVYDPARAIRDDEEFARPFHKKGRCTVSVVR